MLKDGTCLKAKVYDRHVEGRTLRGAVKVDGEWRRVWTQDGATWFEEVK
jgi:hypothetical protein